MSQFFCYVRPVNEKKASYSSGLRGTFFYFTTIVTSQIQEEAERMDAAGKHNPKLTLLKRL